MRRASRAGRVGAMHLVPASLTGQEVTDEHSLLPAAQRLHDVPLVPAAEGALRQGRAAARSLLHVIVLPYSTLPSMPQL